MIILQIVVLLGAIYIGVRLGGIGIGYAGGAGVLVLGLCLGMKPGNIPWDVIMIIGSVIAAISAMQLAGGLQYLVYIAEKILYKNPKYINYLAPIVTYVLTIFAWYGHTAFSMIPVIVEVAKGENIRPSVPLSRSVVSSPDRYYSFSGFRCCYIHDGRFGTLWLELSDAAWNLASYYFRRLHADCVYHDAHFQTGPI